MRLPFLTVAVIAVAIVLSVPVLADKKQSQTEIAQVSAIKESSQVEITLTNKVTETITPMTEAVVEEYISKYDFKALQEENADIVAWVEVPGSQIDYPVLFDGTDKYLHMNLGREDSTAGSIYVDATSEKALNETINIIYGHHMKNGSMFAAIDDYSDNDFWNGHQEINIYMEDKEMNLRPAVCVVGKSDISLRDIKDADSLNRFCDNKTVTQGEIPAEWSEMYVLVTCNYTGSNYKTYLFCTK